MKLSSEVIEILSAKGVTVSGDKVERQCDISESEMKESFAQFIYYLEWPDEITYNLMDPEDEEDEEDELMWDINFAYNPLELLTEEHHPQYAGTRFLMCGIYDGGNYLLAFNLDDLETDDPTVFIFDHEDDGPPDEMKLSVLLSGMCIEEE